MKVFVDASALIALNDRTDQFHSDATELFRQNVRQHTQWITTNYVLIETLNYLKSLAGHYVAEDFGNHFRRGRFTALQWIDEALDQLVWEFFNKHRDHAWSYVDCASFVVMRRENIQLAFTFDEHFRQAGFQTLK